MIVDFNWLNLFFYVQEQQMFANIAMIKQHGKQRAIRSTNLTLTALDGDLVEGPTAI